MNKLNQKLVKRADLLKITRARACTHTHTHTHTQSNARARTQISFLIQYPFHLTTVNHLAVTGKLTWH